MFAATGAAPFRTRKCAAAVWSQRAVEVIRRFVLEDLMSGIGGYCGLVLLSPRLSGLDPEPSRPPIDALPKGSFSLDARLSGGLICEPGTRRLEVGAPRYSITSSASASSLTGSPGNSRYEPSSCATKFGYFIKNPYIQDATSSIEPPFAGDVDGRIIGDAHI